VPSFIRGWSAGAKKNTKQPIGVELVTIEAVVRTSYQQLVSRSAQSSSLVFVVV